MPGARISEGPVFFGASSELSRIQQYSLALRFVQKSLNGSDFPQLNSKSQPEPLIETHEKDNKSSQVPNSLSLNLVRSIY